MSLLTQFGDKHTYSGGYQLRKETHTHSPKQVSQTIQERLAKGSKLASQTIQE